MSRRRTASRFALTVTLLGLAWGCAAEPRARVARPIPAQQAAFLLDPATLATEPEAEEISRLYRRLLAGEPGAELREALARRATPAHADSAAALLLAQVELVGGDLEAARRALDAVVGDAGTAAPTRLLAARLAELGGEPWTAYSHYDALAHELAIAAERREALRASAAEELRTEIARALDEGRTEEAAGKLDRLLEMDARDRETQELQARIGAARGDLLQELEAVRALVAHEPADLALRLRQGELEVEAGDAGVGFALLEEMAAEHGDDARVHLALARAKFSYRWINSPEVVRRLARAPQLSRGDFARLLYWLVPAVRTARPGATRIATDVLDHPAREEIVRIANLELLRIDEAMHRFDPDRDVTRAEVFQALARLAGERTETAAQSCVYALRQRWIAEAAECLPTAPVAGAEATEWLRQADRSTIAGGDR